MAGTDWRSDYLAVGIIRPTIEEFRGQWLNFNADRSKEVKVGKSDKKRGVWRSICQSAPKKGWVADTTCCKAHVFVTKAFKGSDEFKCVSVNLRHSCKQEDANPRKRQYIDSYLKNASIGLKLFVPPSKKNGGGARQLQATAKSVGYEMTFTHASKSVCRMREDSVGNQIGQYFLLPGLFARFQAEDPLGYYALELRVCPWDHSKQQFVRYYICMGLSKEMWRQGNIGLVVADGTFTTYGVFKHTMLIAVSFDGNNQIVVLAFAACDIENTSNWCWFLSRLLQDFPGIHVFQADADKGIESIQFKNMLAGIHALPGRCALHLARNCGEHIDGKFNEKDK